MIILDLGGVVLKESEIFLYQNLPQNILQSLAPEIVHMRIFNRAFGFINLIKGKDCKMPWLLGTLSGADIADTVKQNIDKPEFDSYFQSSQERTLIKYGVDMVFDPIQLTQWTQLNREAVEFIERCKAKGLRLMILSNWDPVSFDRIKIKFKELFAHFDDKDIVIPATVGFAKPDKRIYELMIKKAQVPAERCFFIDDSKANVEAARACGITSILHSDWKTTQEQLKALDPTFR